jgi:hypothetical protein
VEGEPRAIQVLCSDAPTVQAVMFEQ